MVQPNGHHETHWINPLDTMKTHWTRNCDNPLGVIPLGLLSIGLFDPLGYWLPLGFYPLDSVTNGLWVSDPMGSVMLICPGKHGTRGPGVNLVWFPIGQSVDLAGMRTRGPGVPWVAGGWGPHGSGCRVAGEVPRNPRIKFQSENPMEINP